MPENYITSRCVHCGRILYQQGGLWGDSSVSTITDRPLVVSMICPEKGAPFFHVAETDAEV